MKKAITTLRWHSIYADIKPKVGDKCLISDDDGNIKVAVYASVGNENKFFDLQDLLDTSIHNYVYCWAKIPEILSDIQLNNVDNEA